VAAAIGKGDAFGPFGPQAFLRLRQGMRN
jgi:hypothetical protein